MANESGTSLSLLQRIRNGDASGWRRVVDLYAPLVHHWCRRWGAQGADVDDLAQEVFQAASQSLESFRRERAGDTFRGWLRAITRNKVLIYWRGRGKRTEAVGGSEAWQQLQDLPGPDEDTDDAEQVSAVMHRALGLLRAEFEQRTWQAFWRVAVDELSAGEAAAELGMTANAVRMAKSRVLRRLREELGDLVQ